MSLDFCRLAFFILIQKSPYFWIYISILIAHLTQKRCFWGKMIRRVVSPIYLGFANESVFTGVLGHIKTLCLWGCELVSKAGPQIADRHPYQKPTHERSECVR
jgi:hypothetical protein